MKNYPTALGYIPNHRYYDKELDFISSYPVLTASVSKGEETITFHRTYITNDGYKADVSSPKKLLPCKINGETVGAAIRLFEPEDHLAVAEGIETALAVYMVTGVPVWATITAGGMKSLIVPDHVKQVDIWADLDLSGTGKKAAHALKQRLLKKGKSVKIHLPDGPIPTGQKSKDWLDALLEEDAA